MVGAAAGAGAGAAIGGIRRTSASDPEIHRPAGLAMTVDGQSGCHAPTLLVIRELAKAV